MQFTPVHRLLGLAPEPLSDEMMDEAIARGIAETDDLDWKSKPPPAKGMAETDYPKALPRWRIAAVERSSTALRREISARRDASMPAS